MDLFGLMANPASHAKHYDHFLMMGFRCTAPGATMFVPPPILRNMAPNMEPEELDKFLELVETM